MKSIQGTIDLPPSKSIAERALHWGILQRREVVLQNAGGLGLSTDLRALAEASGFEIKDAGNVIEMRQSTDHGPKDGSIETRDMDSFLKYLVAFAPNGGDVVIRKPSVSDDDRDTRLLLFRRMGIDYDRIEDDNILYCRPTLNPPEKIKYALPDKNYHLVDSLSDGVLVSGCQVEISSHVEIDRPLASSSGSTGLTFEQVIEESEEDELDRRLRRLKPKEEEKKFVYRLAKQAESAPIQIELPGDHLVALFVGAMALSRRKSSVTVRGLLKSPAIALAFKLFSKLGAEVSVSDSEVETDTLALCDITFSRTGDLTGKRFGGDAVRGLPEISIPLALAGMFASGKTVVRDLPFGSADWRLRVSHVREILHSCGARVGEIEDGLVVEAGQEYAVSRYHEIDDCLCDLLQQSLALILDHDSGFSSPSHFQDSRLFRIYQKLVQH